MFSIHCFHFCIFSIQLYCMCSIHFFHFCMFFTFLFSPNQRGVRLCFFAMLGDGESQKSDGCGGCLVDGSWSTREIRSRSDSRMPTDRVKLGRFFFSAGCHIASPPTPLLTYVPPRNKVFLLIAGHVKGNPMGFYKPWSMKPYLFLWLGCGFGEGDGFLGVTLWSIPGFQDDQHPGRGCGYIPKLHGGKWGWYVKRTVTVEQGRTRGFRLKM